MIAASNPIGGVIAVQQAAEPIDRKMAGAYRFSARGLLLPFDGGRGPRHSNADQRLQRGQCALE